MKEKKKKKKSVNLLCSEGKILQISPPSLQCPSYAVVLSKLGGECNLLSWFLGYYVSVRISVQEGTLIDTSRAQKERNEGKIGTRMSALEQYLLWNFLRIILHAGSSDSSAGKESACNAGDPGSIPGSGRSPGEGTGYPLQYSGASPVAQLVNDSWHGEAGGKEMVLHQSNENNSRNSQNLLLQNSEK